MPRFVFIPDRTLDVRNCTTRRWGAGVDLQVSISGLRPVSIVRDGADGAFMLTTEFNATKTRIALRLHHGAAGVAGADLIANWSNVWFYDATLSPGVQDPMRFLPPRVGATHLLARQFDRLSTRCGRGGGGTTNSHGLHSSARLRSKRRGDHHFRTWRATSRRPRASACSESSKTAACRGALPASAS